MDASEQSFIDFTTAEGGLTPIEDLPAATQNAGKIVQESFAVLSHLLLDSFDADAHGWIRSLDLNWVYNPAINACAFPGETQCHIVFYTGIIERFRQIIYTVAMHPFLFEDRAGSWVLGPGAPLDDWNYLLSSLIAGQKVPAETLIQLEKDLELPINKDRKQLARQLFEFATDFLLIHEVQHFYQGHIYGLPNFQKMGITEAPVSADPGASYTVRRMVETHADIYATKHAMGYISIFDEQQRQGALTQWWVAIGVLFMALEPDPVEYEKWNTQRYAHPHLRLGMVFNWAYSNPSVMNINEQERDRILGDAMKVLTRIEVIAKGKLTFPLKEMLDHKERFDSEFDQWVATFKDNDATLEEGQQRMLKHFAGL